jgi:hypothetical protein
VEHPRKELQSNELKSPYEADGDEREGSRVPRFEEAYLEVLELQAKATQRDDHHYGHSGVLPLLVAVGIVGLLVHFAGLLATIIVLGVIICLLFAVAYASVGEPTNWKL